MSQTGACCCASFSNHVGNALDSPSIRMPLEPCPPASPRRLSPVQLPTRGSRRAGDVSGTSAPDWTGPGRRFMVIGLRTCERPRSSSGDHGCSPGGGKGAPMWITRLPSQLGKWESASGRDGHMTDVCWRWRPGGTGRSSLGYEPGEVDLPLQLPAGKDDPRSRRPSRRHFSV